MDSNCSHQQRGLTMRILEATPCSRCQRDLSDVEEHQESMVIQFRAGYGSVFGDGNVVNGTLCQYCVQEVLGPYLLIRDDDPFEPKITVKVPRQAFQPYQLSAIERDDAPGFRHPTKDELDVLFAQLTDPQKSDDW